VSSKSSTTRIVRGPLVAVLIPNLSFGGPGGWR